MWVLIFKKSRKWPTCVAERIEHYGPYTVEYKYEPQFNIYVKTFFSFTEELKLVVSV